MKCLMTIFALTGFLARAAEDGAFTVDRIIVTGHTPLSSTIDFDGQTLDRATHRGILPSISDWLARSAAGVTIANPQGNPVQPELSYRGHSVSGLLGLPQGLAVYQDGIRVNEAFGDVVNFDTIPEIAVERIAVLSGADPLFGPNALGGAIAVTMKNGFSFDQVSASVDGGWPALANFSVEGGANTLSNEKSDPETIDMAVYWAHSYSGDSGWRNYSPSSQYQGYFDLRLRGADLDTQSQYSAGFSGSLTVSSLNGNGAVPVELAEHDRTKVFTHPDNTGNIAGNLHLHASGDFMERFRIDTRIAYRRLRQTTFNGDESDAGTCPASTGFPDAICFAVVANDPDPRARDLNGDPVSVSAIGSEPYGAINRSITSSDTISANLQFSVGDISPYIPEITAGLGSRTSSTDFESSTELGRLNATRGVDGSGIRLGGNDFNTRLTTGSSLIYGFAGAALDTGTITAKLTTQINTARIVLDDRIGTDLDGTHEFLAFNGAAELGFRFSDTERVFARASRNSRTPSPAELACADETKPCRFPNAFVADPPLEQVIAHSFEIGARGDIDIGPAVLDLHVTGFLINSENDIIFVSAGPLIGSGYFRNAGQTRRQGIEAHARFEAENASIELGYAFIDATFQSTLTIMAADNPNANSNGEIMVQPGDRIPLIPQHSGFARLHYHLTPQIRASIGFNAASDRFYRGDEGNDSIKLPGYITADAAIEARFGNSWHASVGVTNLLNAQYETFGTYGETDEVNIRELDTQPTDPRFVTPGAPLTALARLSYRFGRDK